MAEVIDSACTTVLCNHSFSESHPSSASQPPTTPSIISVHLDSAENHSTSSKSFHSSKSTLSAVGVSSGSPSQSCDTEIEFISVCQPVTELPRYRLRVDPCTAFVGYKNKDFQGARKAIRRLFHTSQPSFTSSCTTVISEDPVTADHQKCTSDSTSEGEGQENEEAEDSWPLTPEQIDRALDYFLLCGLRVSQMARTYEDLDAITNLLEEKQNDLELAAQIGKTLLEKNRDLERRLTEAEQKLAAKEDTVNQLRHNLSVKDNLLQIYTRDLPEESGDDPTTISSEWLSLTSEAGPTNSDSGESFFLTSINFAHLNRKVRELEEENLVLRDEHNRLTATADQLDEHEGALIRDCARQLVSANAHIRTLSDELAKKADAYLVQQSEITRLLTRCVDLENRIKQLTTENELLVNRLNESQTVQFRLTNEVCHLRDKYDECLSLFNEARAEVRALRKRSRRANLRSSIPSSSSSVPLNPPLHCLPSSSTVQLSPTDESSSSEGQTPNGSLASDLAATAAREHAAVNCERLLRAMDHVHTVHTRLSTGSDPLVSPTRMDEAHDEAISSSGFISGSEPLDEAVKSGLADARLVNNSSVQPTMFYREARSHSTPMDDSLKRHSWVGSDSSKYPFAPDCMFRTGLDDTLLSNNPSELYSLSCSKLPQKLQLIKPFQGSDVLQHWQRLATPSFSRALFEEPLPLVQNRAGIACTSSVVLDSPTQVCTQAETESTKSTVIRSQTKPQNNTPPYLRCPKALSSRFGFDHPGQLVGCGIRSRSLENVRSNLCPPAHQAYQPTPSQFSITNLMAALLPFSLSSPQRNFSSPKHQVEAGKTLGVEPIRIQAKSAVSSRGLLDVDKIEKPTSPTSLHRVPAVVSQAGYSHLPTAQPPSHTPLIQNVRTGFPKPSRMVNLTGILEEPQSESAVNPTPNSSEPL